MSLSRDYTGKTIAALKVCQEPDSTGPSELRIRFTDGTLLRVEGETVYYDQYSSGPGLEITETDQDSLLSEWA